MKGQMSRLRNFMYRYASVGSFIVAFVTRQLGITEVLMKGARGWSARGGRGYVGQFSRNSTGRDRHSNSRYPRPPSLEAGACSNKPQTPYPRSYLASNPSLFHSVTRAIYLPSLLSRSASILFLSLLLFVSFASPNYPPLSLDDSTTDLDTSFAEVATTQISSAP